MSLSFGSTDPIQSSSDLSEKETFDKITQRFLPYSYNPSFVTSSWRRFILGSSVDIESCKNEFYHEWHQPKVLSVSTDEGTQWTRIHKILEDKIQHYMDLQGRKTQGTLIPWSSCLRGHTLTEEDPYHPEGDTRSLPLQGLTVGPGVAVLNPSTTVFPFREGTTLRRNRVERG